MSMNLLALTVFGHLVFVTVLASEATDQYPTTVDGILFWWQYNQFPDPHSLNVTERRLCGRSEVSSVCDPNHLISTSKANQIDNLIDSVYNETVCWCSHCARHQKGYIIRVAIMPYMVRLNIVPGNSTYDRLRDTRYYAYYLSQEWQMQGACNESLLILYAKYSNVLFTLTRETTRRHLSDDAVKRVSIAVRSYFMDDATIADGLMEMIRRYKRILKNPRSTRS